MTLQSRFAPLHYLDASTPLDRADIVIAGFPFDSTSSYRSGSRFAPDAIRQASWNLETWDPDLQQDIEEVACSDIGDLQFEQTAPEPFLEIARAALAMLPDGVRLLALGGEHTISLPAIERAMARHPDLAVIQFDAHADLRDEYEGSRFSHACVMKRVQDLVGPEQIASFGIRSATGEEWNWIEQEKMVHPVTVDGMRKALDRFGDRPLYVTFDLDGFDPSEVPGTGTPEPGGFRWNEIVPLVQLLATKNVVGADVVELSPHWDPSGRSEVLAARLVRLMILLLNG